ncbi:MAG: PTS sugar transporter subunit IIA [Solobacterium sp.]|nr:PTS sugar transporter subunit IIA [Solobacterium sp.]
MTGIIITGHGTYASGLTANVKLLAGNDIRLTAIDFTDGCTPETLEKQLQSAIREYEACPVTIILTDIMGGTPYMKAAALSADHPKVRVISGANAPLLLDLVMRNLSGNDADDPDELAESLLNAGQKAMAVFHLQAAGSDEPENTDGI